MDEVLATALPGLVIAPDPDYTGDAGLSISQ
jgi:hypothetical protein